MQLHKAMMLNILKYNWLEREKEENKRKEKFTYGKIIKIIIKELI